MFRYLIDLIGPSTAQVFEETITKRLENLTFSQLQIIIHAAEACNDGLGSFETSLKDNRKSGLTNIIDTHQQKNGTVYLSKPQVLNLCRAAKQAQEQLFTHSIIENVALLCPAELIQTHALCLQKPYTPGQFEAALKTIHPIMLGATLTHPGVALSEKTLGVLASNIHAELKTRLKNSILKQLPRLSPANLHLISETANNGHLQAGEFESILLQGQTIHDGNMQRKAIRERHKPTSGLEAILQQYPGIHLSQSDIQELREPIKQASEGRAIEPRLAKLAEKNPALHPDELEFPQHLLCPISFTPIFNPVFMSVHYDSENQIPYSIFDKASIEGLYESKNDRQHLKELPHPITRTDFHYQDVIFYTDLSNKIHQLVSQLESIYEINPNVDMELNTLFKLNVYIAKLGKFLQQHFMTKEELVSNDSDHPANTLMSLCEASHSKMIDLQIKREIEKLSLDLLHLLTLELHSLEHDAAEINDPQRQLAKSFKLGIKIAKMINFLNLTFQHEKNKNIEGLIEFYKEHLAKLCKANPALALFGFHTKEFSLNQDDEVAIEHTQNTLNLIHRYEQTTPLLFEQALHILNVINNAKLHMKSIHIIINELIQFNAHYEEALEKINQAKNDVATFEDDFKNILKQNQADIPEQVMGEFHDQQLYERISMYHKSVIAAHQLILDIMGTMQEIANDSHDTLEQLCMPFNNMIRQLSGRHPAVGLPLPARGLSASGMGEEPQPHQPSPYIPFFLRGGYAQNMFGMQFGANIYGPYGVVGATMFALLNGMNQQHGQQAPQQPHNNDDNSLARPSNLNGLNGSKE